MAASSSAPAEPLAPPVAAATGDAATGVDAVKDAGAAGAGAGADTGTVAGADTGTAVTTVSEPGRIVQLEETVINRIAAGEVVVRPANALKELMENSIDAGSKQISVFVKAGGMKMLRIEDDGHGIRRADLPILCERFTTSKLRTYDDLASIGTFGFRGEALASISHVGHVTVTTMTREDDTATVVQYTDGRPRGAARPCAGTRGTTILVEDLFYNNSTRRQALGKDSVEHARLLDVMQKYALHYPTVAFSCRKAGSSIAELQTPGGEGARTEDAVGIVYGQAVARELFSFEDSCEDPRFEFSGFASGPNFSRRSCNFVLFINHRLVECAPLRRAVEAAYQPVLPRHQHPWVYLSLTVDAASIDVNVHPTKSEVQFLHEESIAQRLQECLAKRLREKGGSRSFEQQQGLLARPRSAADFFQAAPAAAAGGGGASASEAADAGAAASSAADAPQRGAAVPKPTRVRTDHGQRSLASVWRDAGSVTAAERPVARPFPRLHGADGDAPESAATGDAVMVASAAGDAAASSAESARPGVWPRDQRRAAYEEAQQLTSICELRRSAQTASGSSELSDSLHKSVYVGPVNRELVLLQCGPALCLVNLERVARECAYQRMLRLFGGLSPVVLAEPLPLQSLLRLGILDPDSGFDEELHKQLDVDALATTFATLLGEKAEMLAEYLAFDLAEGQLRALPNVLGLTASAGLRLEGLPLYLVRLCATVNWTDEKACFEDLCRISADFFVDALLPSEEDAEAAAGDTVAAAVASTNEQRSDAAGSANAAVEAGEFEDVAAAAMAASAASAKRARRGGSQTALEGLRWLHEAVRKDGSCRWPADYTRDGTVVELASLNQLYRIFERC
eukprot:TRINITY_DN29165_c0_g1_i1.p1 TRINITY_DN29165_c0_g1~~TRINITY_DN29165_c0_g1_i1.p1  ORF type:complete len:876 (-),score=231.36 TRINITY_DN29165_c0_g1_i1:104-2668(-)